MVKKYVPKDYPCLIPLCTAKVEKAGQRCSVHKVWTNGPHDLPCVLCRQPIVRGELWRLQEERPVHGACVARRARPRKPKAEQPRLW